MEKLDARINEKQTIQKEITGDFVYCDTQGDFTLPDYLPEIRKIIRIDTTVIPSGKFISANRAEFAGIAAYNLIYSDADGSLASTSLSSEYEFSVPITSDAGDCCVVADASSASTQCRLSGPRKLSLRTSIKNAVHVYCTSAVESVIDDSDTSLQTLEQSIDVMVTKCEGSEEFSLSDSITVDGYTPDNLHINFTSADVIVREARIQDGGVACRGEAYVKCNVSSAVGESFTLTKKIPFEQIVPLSAPNAQYCLAFGRCCFVNCSVAEAAESSVINIELGAELDVECVGNTSITLVKDAYSTECKALPEYKSQSYCTCVGAVMGNCSVDGSRRRSDDEDGIITVIDTSSEALVKSISEKDGRAVIHGECKTESLVCCVRGEGDEVEYMNCPLTFPFKLESDLRVGTSENIEYDCHIDTAMARARMENDTFCVDVELFFTLRASKKQNIQTLDRVQLDTEDKKPHSRGKIVICYPEDGETLYSVAKKYRVPYSGLAALNGIPEHYLTQPNEAITLDGISHLVIPR